MAEYKVVNSMKTGSFDGSYGHMLKYAVEFEGEPDPVEVNQKPETPAPKPGDVMSGTIEPGKFGKRFKKESKGNFGATKFDSEGMAWGNSLTNATNLVIATPNNISDPLKVAEKVVEVANYFMMSRPTKSTAAVSEAATTPQSDDEPPVEARQPEGDSIDLDAIPF